jgi:hypothetical protein
MPRHAPGTVPSLIILAAATLLTLEDRRRRKRAERLNREGRCARCGGSLDGPGHRVPIAGGPRFVWRGSVCERCYGVVRLQERIFWIFLAVAMAILVYLTWWSLQPRPSL